MSDTDSTTKPELLPCPFCGSADVDFDDVAAGNDIFCVKCNGCRAKSVYLGDIPYRFEKLTEAWNRRA
jgi:Lar family restriction alleviation protein